MRRGFTLIEVMVSITILVILIGLVYESFVSVINTTELARAEAAHLRERQFLLRSFSENMGAIYTDPACALTEFALTGEDLSGPAGPGDTISFCTSMPMRGAGALPGQMRSVTYEVIDPGDADAETPTAGFSGDAGTGGEDAPAFLLITETPVVHEQGSDGVSVEDDIDEGMSRSYQVPISSLDIRYYDSEAQDWVEQWDSTENQVMPWAIGVMINLARTADEEAELGADPEEPDLDMTFVLPLGAGTVDPFIDPNHYSIDPGTNGDPDSIFNKDARDKTRTGGGGGGNSRRGGGGSNRNYN